MIKFLDLYKQYLTIRREIDIAIADVIRRSAFIGGDRVSRFESSFAEYQQAKYCIGVANGTDAIEIALQALSLRAGSEVIVPANSFIASAEAVTRAGYRVVFADIDANTYTLDITDVERRITPKTGAIMAVHLYGHPCDMERIIALADRYHLRVIEDCAQAHGAEYKGRRVGSIGDIGTFSFYPGKNLGAYGDAGAIVTNDHDLANRCRMIANHGRSDKYNHEFEGRNSRLDGLQAAILEVKLAYLDEWTAARIRLAQNYLRVLTAAPGLVLPHANSAVRHVYHLFVIRTPKRDALISRLQAVGIQTGIHYPIALPKLKAYSYLGEPELSMRACQFDSQLLSLPIGEHLCEADVEAVGRAITQFLIGEGGLLCGTRTSERQ